MSPATNDAIHKWIDEAGAAMGGAAAERKEALLELESTIYERLDEQTNAGVEEGAAVESVLDSLGSATEMGHACMPQTPIIRPELSRSFFMFTWALFAVHFVLIIAATMAGREFALPPLHFRPIEQQSGRCSLSPIFPWHWRKPGSRSKRDAQVPDSRWHYATGWPATRIARQPRRPGYETTAASLPVPNGMGSTATGRARTASSSPTERSRPRQLDSSWSDS